MTTNTSINQWPTTYQFKGDIRNLKIRVDLYYVGTLSFGSLPSFEQFSAQHTGNGGRHHHLIATDNGLSLCGGYTNTPGKLVENRTIKWQEKISKPDIALASSQQPIQGALSEKHAAVPEDPISSHSPVDEEDVEEEEEVGLAKLDELEPDSLAMPAVSQETSTKDSKKILFTYTNSDLTNMKKAGTDNNEAVSTTYDNSQFLRPRKVAPLSGSVLKNPISDKLSVEQHRKQSSLSNFKQTMCVMGYFGSLDCRPDELSNGYDAADEQLLCQITLQNGRLLKFGPDLGSHSIKTRHGSYSYTISVQEEGPLEFDSLVERFDESLRISQQENDGQEEADSQKNGLFDLPEVHIHWMHYFINVEEGFNFPHDGLFVEYTVELPANVEAVNKDHLNGRSQLCYSKEEGRKDVVRFSLPIQFTLAYSTWKRQHGEVITWSRLLLRVVSEDSWHRFYIDGYASVSLPIQPGQYSERVECWRVINPYSHLATMRELYLGQAVDLNSLEMAGCRDSNQHWSKIYSRVGLCTEGSGTVKLSIQCLYQNRQYIGSSVLRSLKYGSLMQRIGMSGSMHWRIMRVLKEFEQAKQQLLRLRTKKIPLIESNG